ncbi:MAG: transporter [Bacteroidetes bacterium RIFOXYA12_FULL_35_11]|nr:MAG: transporter [Bacteroidetes bacterium GWF2_35_48]OFY76525.1 MAG: transporter [Bacteroidetes bacterium RIFOXYA12_FULL_35_11]
MLVITHLLKLMLLVIIITVLALPLNAQILTLQQCIDTAQVHNKNLQIGMNNKALSVQKSKEAKAGLIPKITAITEYKYYTEMPTQLMPLSAFNGPVGKFKETQFGVPHNINANLQLTMPLYNSQIFGAIKTTEIAEELTELQYQKTEEQIFFEISNLYYNAQILNQQLFFIDTNIINTSKLLENIKLLKDQLMVKATDVSKVQLQLEQLNTQREIINSKYEQVMNALKFTMGIPIIQNIQIEQNISFQKSNEYASSVTVDVRITEVQNRLLLNELRTLKRSRIPTLSLFGTYGNTGYGYDEKPNDFLKFYPVGFVGVQLTSTLFNGTITKRKINQKKIEIQNSEIQMNLITEQNTMLIGNAKRQKIVAYKSTETTLEQIKLAKAIYEQTSLQQHEGTATLTDVLLADNSIREAQQAYLSAIIDYLKADLELKKLTGNIGSITIKR